MNKVVEILGTKYSVVETDDTEVIALSECDGFCDQYSKEIVIDTLEKSKDSLMCVKDLQEFKNKVLRHEVIHAFLGESGLRNNSGWAEDEEMVDWIAIQFHKIADVFNKLGI